MGDASVYPGGCGCVAAVALSEIVAASSLDSANNLNGLYRWTNDGLLPAKATAHAGKGPQPIALDVQDVLSLSYEVVCTDFSGPTVPHVAPLMLASLALIRTGGVSNYTRPDSCAQDVRAGLCGMLVSTAERLARSDGYSRYGTDITAEALHDPYTALYFASALVAHNLEQGLHEGTEEAAVRTFTAGWKGASDKATLRYWRKYKAAKEALQKLEAACSGSSSGSHIMHIIQQGETLNSIAKDILESNAEAKQAGDGLAPGDCIAIPISRRIPRLHVVRHGENAGTIATLYNITPGRLLRANPRLTELKSLDRGWVLRIPGLRGDSQVSLPDSLAACWGSLEHTFSYVVPSSERLSALASRYHTTVEAILVANPLLDLGGGRHMVHKGQVLRIPIAW